MLDAGGGVFPNTLSAPKSVWVSSLDGGPRSRDFGARETLFRIREVWRQRLHMKALGEAIALNCN
jgi:hypothetical protein